MINLPEQLQNERGRIHQLLLNVGSPWYGAGVTAPTSPYTWPDFGTVSYHVAGVPGDPGGQLYIILSNIHVGDYGPIAWSSETQTGHPETERYEERVQVAAGDTYQRTISHTYSDHTTLLESTKLGFESALKVTFGGEKIFAQAELEAKVTAEYDDQFGSEKQFSQTDSTQLDIKGPADRTYIFQRKKVNATRRTSCKPLMAYGIELRRDYNTGAAQTAGLYERVDWADQGEFLGMIRGLAPDSVGRRIYTTADYSNFKFSFPEHDGGSIAPFFRAHAQPNAELVHALEPASWTENYVAVLSQSLTYQDHQSGKMYWVDLETGNEHEMAA